MTVCGRDVPIDGQAPMAGIAAELPFNHGIVSDSSTGQSRRSRSGSYKGTRRIRVPEISGRIEINTTFDALDLTHRASFFRSRTLSYTYRICQKS